MTAPEELRRDGHREEDEDERPVIDEEVDKLDLVGELRSDDNVRRVADECHRASGGGGGGRVVQGGAGWWRVVEGGVGWCRVV